MKEAHYKRVIRDGGRHGYEKRCESCGMVEFKGFAATPPNAVVDNKFRNSGWYETKGGWICPTCMQARKGRKPKNWKNPNAAPAVSERVPTRTEILNLAKSSGLDIILKHLQCSLTGATLVLRRAESLVTVAGFVGTLEEKFSKLGAIEATLEPFVLADNDGSDFRFRTYVALQIKWVAG